MAPASLDTVKRLCTRNLSLKLLSLAVALCIWSFTAISREQRFDLALPVELRNMPPGYSLAGEPPRVIRFTLTGPSILIEGARRSNTALILNLRGAAAGRTFFSHLETYLKLPEGVNVTRITPAVLEIDLTRDQTHLSEGDHKQ